LKDKTKNKRELRKRHDTIFDEVDEKGESLLDKTQIASILEKYCEE
jgi:hypothetical protein